MKAENKERLVRNNIIMPIPANRQKLESASREELVPKKNAIAFVTEVIVTEDPA